MLQRNARHTGNHLMSEARGLPLARSKGCAFLLTLVLSFAVGAFVPSAKAGDREYGAFGPEGARMREQLWILPSGDPSTPMRATLFRPDASVAGNKPVPLVVINHGTDEATRLAVSMPVYYWLSRWFVERGYAVVLPQRRGHGATGGPLVESIGTCENPDHYASGNVAADDIAAAVNYMTAQSFVAKTGVIVVGVSTGGWASLALAARNLPQIEAVVNFAGGRGGHAYGHPNAICGTQQLLSAAKRYASHAHEPTVWFYAKNDSYFGPKLAQGLAQAWAGAGGSVEEHILPPYGDDGHTIADDRYGWDIWGQALESFLTRTHESAQKAVEMAARRQPRSSSMIETSTIETTSK
jgi:dienelactone hydrolase